MLGLVPLKERNMAQNNVGAGQALSLPLTHDCILTTWPTFSKHNPINARELGKPLHESAQKHLYYQKNNVWLCSTDCE